jgi:hypothetical protein
LRLCPRAGEQAHAAQQDKADPQAFHDQTSRLFREVGPSLFGVAPLLRVSKKAKHSNKIRPITRFYWG